jgi:hypothetical protein
VSKKEEIENTSSKNLTFLLINSSNKKMEMANKQNSECFSLPQQLFFLRCHAFLILGSYDDGGPASVCD